MINKIKSILYTVDIIGLNPQLFIFKNTRYKTVFSFVISILIILFSITFIILSLSQYLKYDNPIISYSKGNDEVTKRSIFIKDTFLMFQLIDSTTKKNINKSIAYYEADYEVLYDNVKRERRTLEIEKCELGKNIDIKFETYINDKSKYGMPLGDFYCIGSKDSNIPLFYHPNNGQSFINLNIILKNNESYIPEKIQSLIVCENNLIDHNNKDNPIRNSYIYHFTPSYSSSQFSTINYNIQYIKYESDDGLFYKNNKDFKGITFSDLNYYVNMNDNYDLKKNFETYNSSKIGTIAFSINKSSFDYYKRTYQRLQSLLAEVMSVISLLIEIGRILSFFLCYKKMSTDIIENLLNKNINQRINTQNIKINNLNKSYEENKISSTEKDFELNEKKNNTYYLKKKINLI